MNRSAKQALSDIKDYLENELKVEFFTFLRDGTNCRDTWVVFGDNLYTKENRRMNQELGLWGVNKGSHNMSRK
jgi:hypothetical protein